MTLAETIDELGAARTNKKEFLEKIERIVPWETFIAIIQPFYYKREKGNKPYPLELMLRIFLLQNVYDLADMAVMNKVIDRRTFSNFCGVNSPNEAPDGDTIGRFRNLLTRHGLQEKIFAEAVKILTEKGLILKKEQLLILLLSSRQLQQRTRKRSVIRKLVQEKRAIRGTLDTRRISV